MLCRPVSLFLALALLAASAIADDFTRDLDQWKADRVARLTAPDSWLSLIGLHWLQRGENSVGTAEDCSIRLAAGPAYLGTVHLSTDDRVTFIAAPGSLAESDGTPLPGSRAGTVELSYGETRPSKVVARNVSFFVIQRGDKLGLRVRDTESPRRVQFVGIDYFPADPTWRIVADWVPFDPPREIPIANVLGQVTPNKVPGKAVFTHAGQTYELLAVGEIASDSLFFIIADETSGDETYGAARFLNASRPRDGKVVLDFNRATNPPCAFTPFATCPLPPKENRLPFRVTAGEKNYRGEH